MARSENRPASKSLVPDPARSYERAKPDEEAGMGQLDTNRDAIPEDRPDEPAKAVKNRRRPRETGAPDQTSQRAQPAPDQPDHSMHEEEPLGWDQAPLDITNPRAKRHPRTEGKGGTP